MKCPVDDCDGDWNVYSLRKDVSPNGNEQTIQYRKCNSCGHTGKTIKQIWVCEIEPICYQ